MPDDIAELADGERLCYCTCRWEYIRQVVEPVGNRCILHDIALVQNVGPRWGNGDVERIGVSGRELDPQ